MSELSSRYELLPCPMCAAKRSQIMLAGTIYCGSCGMNGAEVALSDRHSMIFPVAQPKSKKEPQLMYCRCGWEYAGLDPIGAWNMHATEILVQYWNNLERGVNRLRPAECGIVIRTLFHICGEGGCFFGDSSRDAIRMVMEDPKSRRSAFQELREVAEGKREVYHQIGPENQKRLAAIALAKLSAAYQEGE